MKLRERVRTRRGVMGRAGKPETRFEIRGRQRVGRVCTLTMHSVRRVALASRRVATSSAAKSATPALRAQWTARRCLHVRRALPYAVEDGLAPLFTPEALQTIGVEYQQGLLDRLNEEIRGKWCIAGVLCAINDRTSRVGTAHVNKTVAQIVIDTAPAPTETLTFNYASEALNNDFFLHHLVCNGFLIVLLRH